jgi:hypothetical protein
MPAFRRAILETQQNVDRQQESCAFAILRPDKCKSTPWRSKQEENMPSWSLKRIGTAALGAATIAVTIALPAAAGDGIGFALDWVVNGTHAGYFVAQDKGYYGDAGLDVTLSRGFGSGDTVKRVAAGTATFGLADTGAIIAAEANEEVPIRIVAMIYDRASLGVIYLAESGIKNPKDLEGRKIGRSASGASVNMFPGFLKANNIDRSKIREVVVDGANFLPMLMSAQVDAVLRSRSLWQCHSHAPDDVAKQAGSRPALREGVAARGGLRLRSPRGSDRDHAQDQPGGRGGLGHGRARRHEGDRDDRRNPKSRPWPHRQDENGEDSGHHYHRALIEALRPARGNLPRRFPPRESDRPFRQVAASEQTPRCNAPNTTFWRSAWSRSQWVRPRRLPTGCH